MFSPSSRFQQKVRILAVALALGFMLVPFSARAQEPSKPLSKDDIVGLLKGGVPSSRVTDLVRRMGINFELKPEVEEELKQAGATEPLLALLRELTRTSTQTVIETSPGALVYCDGTFKDQTDSQGRLTLVNLQPGDHTIKITLVGKKDFEQIVHVVAGQAATVRANLEEAGPAPANLQRVESIRLPPSAASSVDLDPHTGRVFTSGGASAGQEVAMIDAESNRVVATLGTGSGAHVNPNTGKVYAAGVYSGSIDVYSSSDGHLITTVKAFDCPVEAAVDSTSNQIWGGAQCGGGNDPVFRIDGMADRLTSGEIGSGGVMSKVFVNPVTHRVYVFAGAGEEEEIDPDSLTRSTAPFRAVVSAANPETNRLYGAALSGSGVLVIDGNSESVLATLPVSSPGPIAVNPARNRVYVVDNSGSSPALKVFDGSTNSLLGSMALSPGDSSSSMAVNSRSGTVYLLISNASVPSLLVIKDGP